MNFHKRSKQYHIFNLVVIAILVLMIFGGAFTTFCDFASNCLITWPIGIILAGIILAYVLSFVIKSYVKSFILTALIIIAGTSAFIYHWIASDISYGKEQEEQRKQNKARVEQLLEVVDREFPNHYSSPAVIKGKAKEEWYEDGKFTVVLYQHPPVISGQGVAEAQYDQATEEGWIPFIAEIDYEINRELVEGSYPFVTADVRFYEGLATELDEQRAQGREWKSFSISETFLIE